MPAATRSVKSTTLTGMPISPLKHSVIPRPTHGHLTEAKLLKAEKKVSRALLSIPHVNGVGVAKTSLEVTLDKRSEAARKAVLAVMSKGAPGIPVTIKVVGTFRPE